MLKNYLKTAYRNLIKFKSFTLINILGLAVGITAVILILQYIQFEYSYDDFHLDGDDIYRVSIKSYREGNLDSDSYVFVPPVGPAMKKDIPEVEEYARISTNRTAYFSVDNNTFKISDIAFADSTFFKIFDFELITGNVNNALTLPYSVILTKSTAEMLFGDSNPVGRKVKLNNADEYIVTGVAKDPPLNSHIRFNVLLSFSSLYQNPNNFMDWNGGNQYITYVKLFRGTNPVSVEQKFPDFMWPYINQQLATINVKFEPYLQPLRDIHLYYNPYSDSNRTTIYIFSAVAVFILLIACVNFINLTTARSAKRAKEVGVRKVLGAGRPVLIRQFLTESVLLSIGALLLALFLTELVMPKFSDLIGKQLTNFYLLDWKLIAGIVFILLVTGLIAGFYPAFYLSSFKPIKTLKAETFTGRKKFSLRNVLVVFQFSLSVALIIITLLVSSQISYLRDKELGFDKENILMLPLVNENLQNSEEALKNELKKLPSVISVTASSNVPANGFTSNGYFPEGINTPMMINVVDVDEDFLKTFDIKISEGRNFSKEFSSDKENYLINETLAKKLGWKNPIGKTITRNGEHKVIGVVKDFNFATLHDNIEPLIITNQPWRNRFNVLSVKLSSADLTGSLSRIQKIWKSFAQTVPFEYYFLDETFDDIYKSELKFREIFFYFSFLAILIALLGLFGLAAYTAEQKTKEIGIRKVFGATSVKIIQELSSKYLMLILVANIIAWPIAYFFTKKWLSDFAYTTGIGIGAFLFAAAITIILALSAVSYQAIKASNTNPIESLKYE